jgi:hypothetical protein
MSDSKKKREQDLEDSGSSRSGRRDKKRDRDDLSASEDKSSSKKSRDKEDKDNKDKDKDKDKKDKDREVKNKDKDKDKKDKDKDKDKKDKDKKDKKDGKKKYTKDYQEEEEEEEEDVVIGAEVRTKDFEKPDFDAERYIKTLLRRADPIQSRQQLKEQLDQVKTTAASKLQVNVFENYSQFIQTSKEVTTLEVDMLELRNFLTEVNSTIKGLQRQGLNFDKSALPQRKRTGKLIRDEELMGNIHWLLELPDELDILTSDRSFAEATNKLLRSRKLVKDNPNLAPVITFIKDDLDARARRLANQMCYDLHNIAMKPNQVSHTLGLLKNLGFVEMAKQTYLEYKTTQLKNEIKKLRFEGDTSIYINELSRIVFSFIDAASDEFKLNFKEPAMMSGFVAWAIRQLDYFADLFRRQVFSAEIDNFTMMGICFNIANAHCKTLDGKGLALTFFLRRAFQRDITSSINNFKSKSESMINKLLTEENFDAKKFDAGNNKTLLLTESANYVYTILQKFINAVLTIINLELLPKVIPAITNTLEKYVFELSTKIETQRNLTDKQYLAIMSNVMNLTDDLIPKITAQFEDTIKRGAEELSALRGRMNLLYADIRLSYANWRATDLLNNKLDWSNMIYKQDSIDNMNAAPSTKIVRLFEYLYNLSIDVGNFVNKNYVKSIVQEVLEQVALGFSEGKFWQNEKDKVKAMFTVSGIQQMVLDFKYCIEASGNYASLKTLDTFRSVIDRALVHYCLATGTQDPSTFLKAEKWFQSIIKNSVANSKTLKELR